MKRDRIKTLLLAEALICALLALALWLFEGDAFSVAGFPGSAVGQGLSALAASGRFGFALAFTLYAAVILLPLYALVHIAARQELEHSRTQAELQNLKSQLNPHFLFNTLNNIYSLIQIDADRAQQAVHDLSRMLRYVLYESSCPTVPLAAEVEFLRDYIELMRIRLPRHVEVGVSLPEEPSPTPVAPLLFISLIENAFKHGTSNDRPSFIRIDIHERGGELVCCIRNSCFPKTASDRSGSGIGLKNLSKRLEMIYPQRHTFEYGERGGTYTASLRIKLHEQ
mgnify:CR=1 FL=1